MRKNYEILIVDYGVGNVASVANMLKRVGVSARTSADVADIRDAPRLILPGVGAFDAAMSQLCNKGADTAVLQAASNGAYILGICLGAQLLLEGSDEGQKPGLGLIQGTARKFDAQQIELPVPHMGWSTIETRPQNRLFGISDEPCRFYFAHSYYMDCTQPDDIAATAIYGNEFSCAIERGRIFGVQFHPEKSHRFGMQFFERFAGITC